ncbi:CPBP family intramembrane metalloprotease [Fructobacillus sp. M1-13]|uniref:CPBP family intramembrane metalloprotease n=1 Tax=Fructobacillus papyriferae TaxID=2713171 RepID=A0ABS5QN99_9LACO|nr:CPBP family intramembrane glutamic endopeptidase [Fructobacillus papyriferae]MBS9334466.1 CPBP family intramembrane metalloprotease [Fructobacillus papyriferae]MCD2158455.1 CPBP family intramembrane metalloprotease [Fructobacillus papyriferae]
MKTFNFFKTTGQLIILILLIVFLILIAKIELISDSILNSFVALVLYVLGIILSVFLIRKFLKVDLTFSRLNRFDWKVIVQNYISQIILISFIFGLMMLFKLNGANVNQKNIVTEFLGSNPFSLFCFIFTTVVLAPIFEELVFRAFLMNVFSRKSLTITSSVISATAFSFLHLPGYFISLDNLYPFLIYFVIGLSFATAYRQTKKISASIVLHGMNNLFSTGLILFTMWLEHLASA